MYDDPFETVIGLEVHVELATATKMFCACAASFGDPPNTHTCPVCLALPGALPVPNSHAVELAVRAALALHCKISPVTRFDRKNYHYPDLPKGYQISQYDQPIGLDGHLNIPLAEGEQRIRIRRLHLEEDTGKSSHDSGVGTLVDLNRAGVPLIEIVSEPDLRSAEEARAYLEELRDVMLHMQVSDVKMEEGSLRCDANVSIRPRGSREFGNLVEVKNMNSFKSVKQALEYEASRQREVVTNGGRIARETRHWDERAGQTRDSRSKEEADDYRYFPEPDLVPLHLEAGWLQAVAEALPELPEMRRGRYAAMGVRAYDARVLVAQRHLGEFLDAAVKAGADPQTAANWTLGEWQAYLNDTGDSLEQRAKAPSQLAALLKLVDGSVITGKVAKDIFRDMITSGRDPAQIVEESGQRQMADDSDLLPAVQKIVADNPKAVADYRGGKMNAVGFLVGQVMKATRGRANPERANELVRKVLDA